MTKDPQLERHELNNAFTTNAHLDIGFFLMNGPQ